MSNFTLPPLIISILILAGISHGLLVGPTVPSTKTTATIILPPPSQQTQPSLARTVERTVPSILPNTLDTQNEARQTPTIKKTHAPNQKIAANTSPAVVNVETTSQPPPPQPQPPSSPDLNTDSSVPIKPALTKSQPAAKPIAETIRASVDATSQTSANSKHPLPDNNNYLIQLIGSPDKADIQRFLRLRKKHLYGQAQINQIMIHRDGRPWNLLLMGPYDGYRKAKQAFKKLPAEIQKYEPWLRKADSLPSKVSSETILLTTGN